MSNQTVGTIGLSYTCYRLSRLDWNVMPTSRNARGIDIPAYSQDASRKPTIQVKALSKRSPVLLGNKLDHFFADFLVMCRYVGKDKPECVGTDQPECFVLTGAEVKQFARHGVKEGKGTWWESGRAWR